MIQGQRMGVFSVETSERPGGCARLHLFLPESCLFLCGGHVFGRSKSTARSSDFGDFGSHPVERLTCLCYRRRCARRVASRSGSGPQGGALRVLLHQASDPGSGPLERLEVGQGFEVRVGVLEIQSLVVCLTTHSALCSSYC